MLHKAKPDSKRIQRFATELSGFGLKSQKARQIARRGRWHGFDSSRDGICYYTVTVFNWRAQLSSRRNDVARTSGH